MKSVLVPFSIDLRTLALFRILLAIGLLLDLITRGYDLTAHYSDFGVVPRGVQIDALSDASLSIHLLNGHPLVQAFLFAIAASIACLLLVGYRTRLMTVLSWFLLLSLQNRNTFILSGEDNLLLLLTFWAMFLPLNARYSIDAALDKEAPEHPNKFLSFATAAILLQGMSMYFFSALLKSHDVWVSDGTAVYYALNLDYFATPVALWFRQFKPPMQALTHYVWCLELVGPVLIFSPLFFGFLRPTIMLAFITMHVGFFMCLEIGLFPYHSIVMNLLFLPSSFWNWLEGKFVPREQSVTIFYDKDCGFCLKMCLLIKQFLVLRRAEIEPAQDNAVAAKLLATHNSWVVVSNNTNHLKWSAFGALISASPVFKFLGYFARVNWIERLGNQIYDLVAINRSNFSQFTTVVLPFRRLSIPSSYFTNGLAIVCFCFVTIQNISTLPAAGLSLPYEYRMVRQFLGLYQNWTMFAPFPELDSPWPIIEGRLKNGTVVDVYNEIEEAPSYDKPNVVSAVYRSSRWRKFLAILEDQTYTNGPRTLALNYGRYLCRRWNVNAEPERELATFTIVFHVERTQPPGVPKILDKRLVWTHDCFA